MKTILIRFFITIGLFVAMAPILVADVETEIEDPYASVSILSIGKNRCLIVITYYVKDRGNSIGLKDIYADKTRYSLLTEISTEKPDSTDVFVTKIYSVWSSADSLNLDVSYFTSDGYRLLIPQE